MVNDMISKTITAIINGYDNNLYKKQEKEDISNLSNPILQKKLKKINEQSTYLHVENRLLYNYLIWYEKKIIPIQNQSQEKANSILPSKISHPIKQLLSLEKKCEIAESSFKVLLAYLEKFNLHATESTDQSINSIETDDETINHFEVELLILKKFLQHIQKQITAKEFREFIRDRIQYYETLNERKRQKTVRLRFNLNILEKSIEKIDQIVDRITIVDFEHLKIDIEKQSKEFNTKNKILTYYKQQQLEVNTKFNTKKSELFQELRLLTSIRNEINNKIQQLNHYNQNQQKMQEEIEEYEKSNQSLDQMSLTYRVPSIDNYVNLKSQQINLHHQIQAWQRKLQIAEREHHIRQYESIHYPEIILHPWKYLKNPSSIIFYKHDQI